MLNNKFKIPNVNKQILKVLSKLGPIDNCVNCFYSDIESISEIPKFKFKFMQPFDGKIYYKIKGCIESFNGNLKWTLFFEPDQDPRRFYIIMPNIYAITSCFPGNRQDRKDWYYCKLHPEVLFESDVLGYEKYSQICIAAISDIPNLIDWLKNYFKITM